MSNILTSYIRIFRRDGKAMNEVEIEHLFQLAVRSYETFGSYWVRIIKKYRSLEKCLDIQFGTGKRFHSGNLLEDYDVFREYTVWERTADEGGFRDSIFTLVENKENQYIEVGNLEPCKYRFNKVRISYPDELPSFIEKFEPVSISATEYEIDRTGYYYACNSRSFMDLEENTLFYGPQLGYDPTYTGDYFMPTADGEITASDDNLIRSLFVYPYPELQRKMRVELFWNNRLVQSVEHKDNEISSQSADYWDNCGDAAYLSFIKNR
jgi:hypothetical protein